jgi:predicted enzyme related to lactoylglutathione lyase
MLSLLQPKPASLFFLLALMTIYLGAPSSLLSQDKPLDHHTPPFSPYVWALEYGVADVQRAVDFYTTVLGFEVEDNRCCLPATVLRNGSVRLLLRRNEAKPVEADMAGAHINMRVGDIPATAAIARKKGAVMVDAAPRPFALGQTLTIRDPFGNPFNLLDIKDDGKTVDSKPAVFNIGVAGEKLEALEAFYTSLGFQIYSREYLPDLPLQRHGVVALVLHGGAKKPIRADRRNGTIVLGTSDLKSALQTLQNRGVKIERPSTASSPAGFAAVHDPSGNQLKLMELPAPMLAAANGMAKPNGLALAGFERFKKLQGQWIGRSTKGWEETVTFKTIAQGSVVVENSFDAHPNETMMTMFHLDGQRLMLTHYCVAGNQPRLEATAFENEGQTITFTFIDATNLPSRDKGHMDKAVFRFAGDDRFSSQWTWYQDGKESWMEEIKYERKP